MFISVHLPIVSSSLTSQSYQLNYRPLHTLISPNWLPRVIRLISSVLSLIFIFLLFFFFTFSIRSIIISTSVKNFRNVTRYFDYDSSIQILSIDLFLYKLWKRFYINLTNLNLIILLSIMLLTLLQVQRLFQQKYQLCSNSIVLKWS